MRSSDKKRRAEAERRIARAKRAEKPRPLKPGMRKVCFVVVYFGKWPVWFPAFLQSCKRNPSINWMFFTDCAPPACHPPNVAFHEKTLSQMRSLIRSKIGSDAGLEDRYKIPDYKPAYGLLFEDYLHDVDFWGHCDIDIIWGDIRKYVTEDILDTCDVFSTRKRMISGHFSLFKNARGINELFLQSPEFASIAQQAECLGFDEDGMTRLIAPLARAGSLRVHWPKFQQNYAVARTDTPSRLPQYVNKYLWKKGKLFDCTGKSAAEILYLHFMTWKKTLTSCEFGYRADPEKFYISYSGISMQPIPPQHAHRRRRCR